VYHDTSNEVALFQRRFAANFIENWLGEEKNDEKLLAF